MKILSILMALGFVFQADASDDVSGELERLNADSFLEREEAYQNLNDWSKLHSEEAIPFLYSAFSETKSPESKTRILSLLKKRVLLAKYGKPKGFVGIRMENGVSSIKGELIATVSIMAVEPDSPAEKFGLNVGDAIMSVDGKGFTKNAFASEQFRLRVTAKSAGDRVSLEILRGKKFLKLDLTLGSMPEALERAYNRLKGINPKDQKQEYFEDWLSKQELKPTS